MNRRDLEMRAVAAGLRAAAQVYEAALEQREERRHQRGGEAVHLTPPVNLSPAGLLSSEEREEQYHQMALTSQRQRDDAAQRVKDLEQELVLLRARGGDKTSCADCGLEYESNHACPRAGGAESGALG